MRPVQITFRHMESSAAIETLVHECMERVSRHHPKVQSYRVTLEAPHNRHQKGTRFHVRVEVTLPGGPVVVSRDRSDDPGHENAYQTVRDAFDAAEQELTHLEGRRDAAAARSTRAVD